MLKVSTRSRYGLRAMCELARSRNDGPVEMSTIAERQHLSRKYLHNLLSELRKAGLVESVRGAHGGFRLTRPPEDISLYSIFEVLEGQLSIVDCLALETEGCEMSAVCVTRELWSEINATVGHILKTRTLASLVSQSSVA